MNVIGCFRDLAAIRLQLDGAQLAFIPTMGALHSGHLKLVEAAKSKRQIVFVSIFVNPLQFNNHNDLLLYPRTLNQDLSMLELARVDYVFAPSVNDVYTKDFKDVVVDLGALENRYEGEKRPGHFNGVLQVLFRLFHFIKPNEVYFGQKDLQQCLVVKKLLAQHFPQIISHQIVTARELSGLALSSRNVKLSETGLINAAEIHRNLKSLNCGIMEFVDAQFDKIALTNLGNQFNNAIENLQNTGFSIEYLDWVSLPNLDPILTSEDFQKTLEFDKIAPPKGECALVFAGFLEGVRLIDNLVFEV